MAIEDGEKSGAWLVEIVNGDIIYNEYYKYILLSYMVFLMGKFLSSR
jgi:hypothetical protein